MFIIAGFSRFRSGTAGGRVQGKSFNFSKVLALFKILNSLGDVPQLFFVIGHGPLRA